MESIKAHIFTTIQEAEQAIDLINQSEGIPINEEATTRTYTTHEEINGTILIKADSVTEKYLGKASDFETITDQP